MLKVDLKHLTKEALTDTVSKHCTKLGLVKSVAILSPETPTSHIFALVAMSSPTELEAVVKMFGDRKIGGMAVVRLEQEEQAVPSSISRDTTAGNPAHP